MDQLAFRKAKGDNHSDKDRCWARSILYNEVTEQWCSNNQDNYYTTGGYFPPNIKKLGDKLNAINFLNLKSGNLDILDIGCGCGHLVTLCNALGHSAQGTEIAPVLNSSIADIYKHYNIDVFELKIQRNQKFILPKKYDLIIGLRTTFNTDDSNSFYFNNSNWIFLRDNLFEFLNPKGRIFLKTNIKFNKKNIMTPDQEEILSVFGEPLLGFNTFTYLLEKQ